MTVAEYLKSRGYSSRLVVRLRNTPGSFFVDGTAVFSTCVLKDGNQLQVRVAEKRSSAAVEPVPMDLDILYEDTHLLVVNKPAGMAVHPSQGNHGNTLANGLADYFRKKQEAFVFRAVNRLDKDTSGLLLVAKNGSAPPFSPARWSAGRSAGNTWPLSVGKQMPAERSPSPSGRKEGSAIQRIPDPDHGEAAATRYERLLYNKNTDLSLLRLRLETGRTHQIRVPYEIYRPSPSRGLSLQSRLPVHPPPGPAFGQTFLSPSVHGRGPDLFCPAAGGYGLPVSGTGASFFFPSWGRPRSPYGLLKPLG